MPRIKRWSPISHDFNRDSEIIEMRQRFGDWTALAWQEVLHEADRNDGIVRGTIEQIAMRLAPISLQMYLKRAANTAQMMLRYSLDKSWIIEKVGFIEVANHAKYHRTRDTKQAPFLTRPNQTEPSSHKNDSPIVPKGDDGSFEKFWEEYPKHKRKSKGAARKAWKKINPTSELIVKIISKLVLLKKTITWTKDRGQYVPYPATWLNAEGWEDEVDDFLGTTRKMMSE